MMLDVARAAAPTGVEIAGFTAGFGAPLIAEPEALAVASDAVLALKDDVSDADAVIVSAFSDPGRGRLAAALDVPVVGIAEAGMAAAAGFGRFTILLATPDLRGEIEKLVALYAHQDRLAGIRSTSGDPAAAMADAKSLEAVLAEMTAAAAGEDGADAVVVGGGPMARVADRLAGRLTTPVVQPVRAAVELALRLAR